MRNLFSSGFFKSKFNNDLIWNSVSFTFCALIGLLFNIIIIRFYDSATLGYFNQVYAIFIFLSQVSTWGLHLSVQKYVPQFKDFEPHVSLILTSSLLTTFLFSSLITLMVLLLNKIPGIIFNSTAISEGFIYAVPGLVFFSLNKVLLSYLNGMRQMISFAFFNFLRFALMLALILVIVSRGLPSKYLTLLFTIPELILFVILLGGNFHSLGYSSIRRLVQLSRIQFRFGNRAALGHIVLDLNSKADIILLGIFLPDKSVGIYSFAAFIVDGMLQLFFVFRTNINPIITETFYRQGRNALQQLIRNTIPRFYKIFIVIGISAILLYPFLLKFFEITEHFWMNIAVFSILTCGCLISSGYIPFQMIFNQTGKPRTQSAFLFYIFIVNICLNLLLIPIFGIIGSAIATSIVFVIQMALLKRMVMKVIHISI